MRKRHLLWLLFLPIGLHVFSLFFLHFKDTIHSRDFEYGFDKLYAARVSGLDYSQLDSILSQPFHFLGQGKQMTAFESADGKYVLKFFNPMRPLKGKWYTSWKQWKKCTSLKWISHEWFQKKARLKKLFQRHRLAFDFLREETGLIFVHLFPSERINHLVHILDQKGKMHIFFLNTTPFVIQKKATLVPVYLNDLLRQNKLEEAKFAILQLQELFAKRLEVGVTDRIQTMENNYGFVKNKPIQIDIGRIQIDADLQKNSTEEKLRILGNFQDWLSKNYPELL